MDVRDLKVRPEVEKGVFEPAVRLGDVAKGTAPEFVLDSVSFFQRTHLTDHMKELVVIALMNILGLRECVVGGRTYTANSNLIVLPSDLGGGKTHSMVLLYHIFKLIKEEGRDEVVRKIGVLDKDLADFVDNNWEKLKERELKIVVVDCGFSDLAPSPVKPISIGGRSVKTLWGYLGYELGRYEAVREADEREVAPYSDTLHAILNNSGALVLIDEIGKYYSQSGLDKAKISNFLMNLAESMSSYAVSGVSVVISVPYEFTSGEVTVGTGVEYIYDPELVRAIGKVLKRPNVIIRRPVDKQDLVKILRKRIFEHEKEEFEKMAKDFVASILNTELPSQVRKVLDDRNFWNKVVETYPFHPAFPDLLERITYKLPHLQKTRDAIKIAVQTVKAIKDGLFNELDDKIELIMSYHIPVFVEEFLDESLMSNAPGEYKVFQLILRDNVAEPKKIVELEGATLDDILARPLRNMKDENKSLAFKLLVPIWLHSLVGRGWPVNIPEYPTTADLIYYVSPTDLDVKGVLGILRSTVAQLVVYGNPESDSARWFFTNIPSIDELIEQLQMNVTDGMAKDKLKRLLEEGIKGRRTRGRPPAGYRAEPEVFENCVVVLNVSEIPNEVISSKNPAVIIFADKISKETLEDLLKGRNYLVALAPAVEGLHDPDELSPEDIKGIRELATYSGRSVWDGLLRLLRYYVATESITEENIESFLERSEGLKELAEDLKRLLKSKVDSKKEYYYKHVWNLINRNYRRVYYYRLDKIMYTEGLSLESDKPILPIVEDHLREKELIPPEFTGEWLKNIIESYMGGDVRKINVGNVWNYLRTTTNANVPIISHKMFVEAVKDIIRTLDYAVKINSTLSWKPIFDNKAEADRGDEGNKLLGMVNALLKRLKKTFEDMELVYWEDVFDEWLKQVLDSIPKGKALKLLSQDGAVLDINDVLDSFEPKNMIKSGKLFYEEIKYTVEIKHDTPEMIEGGTYSGKITVFVDDYPGEINVTLSSELPIEPTSFYGSPPLECEFSISAVKAGEHRIHVNIVGEDLRVKRVVPVRVHGEWITREVTSEEAEKLKDRDDVWVLAIKTRDFVATRELLRVAKAIGGELKGEIRVASEQDSVKIDLKTSNPRVFELLYTPLNSLKNIVKHGDVSAGVTLKLNKDKTFKEVSKLLSDFKNLIFKVKMKMG